MGADAVSIGVAALIALGDNSPEHLRRNTASWVPLPGYYDDYQDGRDPAGISTQSDELAARFDPVKGRATAGQLPAGIDAGNPDPGTRLR